MVHSLISYLLVLLATALFLFPFLPFLKVFGISFDQLLLIFQGQSPMVASLVLFNSVAQLAAFALISKWRYFKGRPMRHSLGLSPTFLKKYFLTGIKYWLWVELLRLGYDFFIVKMGWSPGGPGGTTWMTGLSFKHLWMVIVGAVFLNSVGEEIFFRGYIFQKLLEKWSFPLAAVVSSILFGILHGFNVQLPILIIHGLLYAHAMHRTKSVITPAMAHMLANLCVVLYQTFNVVLYGTSPTF